MTSIEQAESAVAFEELAANEKLQYMHEYAKASTIATILAPLLCVPLYMERTHELLFYAWFSAMAFVVVARFFLIKSIKPTHNVQHNLSLLNVAVGVVTFVWGIGWFIFVPTSDAVEYLLYQIISLTILFVGMVGYCVNWKTFFAFVLPLKIPELIFIIFNHEIIIWPIALGSMVAFYLALKMGFLFSKSWEKSFSLRLRNDALIDQLVEEKNASNEANLAKSEFIATASHDLRQPMQSINIFIDMIDPNALKDYERLIFSRLRSSVSILNDMFNTLLNISRLDSNFLTVEADFLISEIVSDLKSTFTDLCDKKELELIFNYSDGVVKGDIRLVEQILRNLLSNAIQYTEAGKITVTFSNSLGFLMFSVEDSGCGIPKEDLLFIFNEFYRSEHSRSRYDGLGLGLSIVSRIVKKIGGECLVNSEVNRGSKFTIKTPYTIRESYVDKSMKSIDDGQTGSGTRSLDLVQDAPEIEGTSVCLGIIENDPSLREAYYKYFTSAGYKVFLILHQEKEFQDCLLNTPKLQFILSDFRLGERDGIYFIRKLREEFNDDIPACIVTADTSPKHLELFSQHNIDVLYKPIDIKELEKLISLNSRKL